MAKYHNGYKVYGGHNLSAPASIPISNDPLLGNLYPVFTIHKDEHRRHWLNKAIEVDARIAQFFTRRNVFLNAFAAEDDFSILINYCFVGEKFTAKQSKHIDKE